MFGFESRPWFATGTWAQPAAKARRSMAAIAHRTHLPSDALSPFAIGNWPLVICNRLQTAISRLPIAMVRS
jgi:hypothetical protein